GAVDYVLKPATDDRLGLTIERLKAKVATQPPDLTGVLARIAEQIGPKSPRLQWIKATVGPNLRLIPVADVLFFQSDEKYTRVVTGESEALIRKPIRELLDELDPARFWQIHRATIVNVDHIAAVRRGLKDQAEVSLKGREETLVVSRAFTHLFKQM
ncbi:MAG TPA: LytTR family DNA-binding domain-containing protein, partial [Usitatibacter sp.]|nr:LytTR family DNA-binding domain-containing protein [Usitatibacter sp.]